MWRANAPGAARNRELRNRESCFLLYFACPLLSNARFNDEIFRFLPALRSGRQRVVDARQLVHQVVGRGSRFVSLRARAKDVAFGEQWEQRAANIPTEKPFLCAA